jgi:hypothetical protein
VLTAATVALGVAFYDHISRENRYAGVFPPEVVRVTNQSGQQHIELSEGNRRTYAAHFKLPDDTPWETIRRTAIDRILERAGDTP